MKNVFVFPATIIFIFLGLTVATYGQSFQRVSGLLNNGAGYFRNSIKAADFNKDGDLDLIIHGGTKTPSLNYGPFFYTNNGDNTFNIDYDFPLRNGINEGEAEVADFNQDGAPDILIVGYKASVPYGSMSVLLLNDGTGKFVDSGYPLHPAEQVDIIDFNQDEFPDIFIHSAYNPEGTTLGTDRLPVVKLYLNDQKGGFTEISDVMSDPLISASTAWLDIDGNSYPDLVVGGYKKGEPPFLLGEQVPIRVYLNENGQTLTPDKDQRILGGNLYGKKIAFGDLNQDQHPDLIVTNASTKRIRSYHEAVKAMTHIYYNDGNGFFQESGVDPLYTGYQTSSLDLADFNADGLLDILVSGDDVPCDISSVNRRPAFTKIFTNLGNGRFAGTIPFTPVSNGSALVADFNRDDQPDVFLTGIAEGNNAKADLYLNGAVDQNNGQLFDGVAYSSSAIADINQDGHVDIVLGGTSSVEGLTKTFKTRVYLNDGSPYFIQDPREPNFGIYPGDPQKTQIALFDVTKDNIPDLIQISPSGSVTIKKNDGTGGFQPINNTTFPVVRNGAMTWSDLDQDGDMDLLLSGLQQNGEKITDIFLNEGEGRFSALPNVDLLPVDQGDLACVDVDGNGKLDILVTGMNASNEPICRLYLQEDDLLFKEFPSDLLLGMENGIISTGDVNNDGMVDLLLVSPEYSFFYLNQGSAGFELFDGFHLEPLQNPAVAIIDVNADGAADILHTGLDMNNKPITLLYSGNGEGLFELFPQDIPFGNIGAGSIQWADVNNDNINDILLTGLNDLGRPVAKLYLHDGSGNYEELLKSYDFKKACEVLAVFTLDSDRNGTPDLIVASTVDESGIPVTNIYQVDEDGNLKANGPTLPGVTATSVLQEDVNGDGKPDLLISGFDENGNPVLKLLLGQQDGSFGEPVDLPVEGINVTSIEATDVDGDGDLDLIVHGTDENGNPITKILINNGDGSYSEGPSIPLSEEDIVSIEKRDIDGDGIPDFVIAYKNDKGELLTAILVNNGDGTFTALVGIPYPPDQVVSVKSIDLNGDGQPDALVQVRNDKGELETIVMLNNGDGTFTPLPAIPYAPDQVVSVDIRDLNGDGQPDVLIQVRNDKGELETIVMLNNGDGTFTPLPAIPYAPDQVVSVDIRDLNGDGQPDVLIQVRNDKGELETIVMLNNGDGTFTPLPAIPYAPDQVVSVDIRDLNGDGQPDVLIQVRNDKGELETIVMLNNGDGTFTPLPAIPYAPDQVVSVDSRDLNGDGLPDVLIQVKNDKGELETIVMLNNGDGTFTPLPAIPYAPDQVVSVDSRDLNGDGQPDVLIQVRNDKGELETIVMLNNGDGTFTPLPAIPYAPDQVVSVDSRDLNGDGLPDVLIQVKNDKGELETIVMLNNGDGTFTPLPAIPYAPDQVVSVDSRDLNGDGLPDVLIQVKNDKGELETIVMLNNGDGTFTPLPAIPYAPDQVVSVDSRDLNGDGLPDVLIQVKNDKGELETIVMLNNGDGTFTALPAIPYAPDQILSISAEDVNGDGLPDLIIKVKNAKGEIETIVMINQGDGTYVIQSKVASTEPEKTIYNINYYGSLSDEYASFRLKIISPEGEEARSTWTLSEKDNNTDHRVHGINQFIYFKPVSALNETKVQIAAVEVNLNGDNQKDLIMSWIDDQGRIENVVLLNQGKGSYTKVEDQPFAQEKIDRMMLYGDRYFPFSNTIRTFGDEPLTGIFLLKMSEDNAPGIRFYLNKGDGKFVDLPNQNFDQIAPQSANLKDVNDDKLEDLLLRGKDASGKSTVKLYLYEGNGQFREDAKPAFANQMATSALFLELNGDDQGEVLLVERDAENQLAGKLYLNDGKGAFQLVTDLPGEYAGITIDKLLVEDLEMDYGPELVVSGKDKSGNSFVRLLRNAKNDFLHEVPFRESQNGRFVNNPPSISNVIAFGRYSNLSFSKKGNYNIIPMLFFSGTDDSGQPVSKMYKFLSTFSQEVDQEFFFEKYDDIEILDAAFISTSGYMEPNLVVSAKRDGNQIFIMFGSSEKFDYDYKNPPTTITGNPGHGTDFNGDQNVDKIILGEDAEGKPLNQLILGGPDNKSTEDDTTVKDIPFARVKALTAGFIDYDLDDNTDIVLLSIDDQGKFKKTYYFGDGKGGFK